MKPGAAACLCPLERLDSAVITLSTAPYSMSGGVPVQSLIRRLATILPPAQAARGGEARRCVATSSRVLPGFAEFSRTG